MIIKVLENYHCSTTFKILLSPGCNYLDIMDS